jgi:WD40 repeat protein
MALKGHSSGAIVAAAFCPAEDALLATGSADGGVRFVSTYTKMIDAADVKDRLGKSGAELCAYQASSVWINALAWNPTGTFLAAATHDSCIHLFSRAADSGSVSFTVSKRLRVLVPRCITFVGELQIVTAGADMFPLAYVIEGGKDLRYVGRWTATKATTAGSNAVKDAMSKFQNEASLGQATKVDQAATKHTSDITVIACVKLSTSPSGDAYSFATTGMDGRVEIWNGNTMERAT